MNTLNDLVQTVTNDALSEEMAKAFLREYLLAVRPIRTISELVALKYALQELSEGIDLGSPYTCEFIVWSARAGVHRRHQFGGELLCPERKAWPVDSSNKRLLFVAKLTPGPEIELQSLGCKYTSFAIFANDFSVQESNSGKLQGRISTSRTLAVEVKVVGCNLVRATDIAPDPDAGPCLPFALAGQGIAGMDYPAAVVPTDCVARIRRFLGVNPLDDHAYLFFRHIFNVPSTKFCPFYWGTDRDSNALPAKDRKSKASKIPFLQFCSLEYFKKPATLRLSSLSVEPQVNDPQISVLIGDGFSYIIGLQGGVLVGDYL